MKREDPSSALAGRVENEARALRPRADGRPPERLPPLVEAKIAPPEVREGTVSRPRVLRLFDVPGDATVALVAAPPGYGKTTAAREWCALRGDPLAWVTLDAGDNDPVRLWTYVASAVDGVSPGLGEGSLLRLRGGAVDGAIDELTNRIAASRRRLIVVLDDVQTVTDADSLASLDRFVERLPAGCRLVMITRTDPRLRLARARARGILAEVRAADLAFTAAEARALLVERCELPSRTTRSTC